MEVRKIPNDPSILQVNTADLGGGAEKIAWDLHHGYLARGYTAWLAVGRKRSDAPGILEIPNEACQAFWIKLSKKISTMDAPLPDRFRRFFMHLAKFHYRRAKKHGHENFYFPGTRHLLKLPPQKADILHCHNLHGEYFDLRLLSSLSRRIPTVLTLHDAWLLAGHCSHSLDCERWKTGCGSCPYLTIPVSLQRDGSADNWRRKRKIYEKSRVYVATPSQWLMHHVEQSILAPAIEEHRVIPNGVDLSVFHPADKRKVREQVGISQDVFVLLFTASKVRQSVWKDYHTLRCAVELLANRYQDRPILFIALGEGGKQEQIGSASIEFVPYQEVPAMVAQYYQAADLYIHAANADNFPNTVLEALACGTPVVATAVGGIPEQIDEGKTGFLVSPKTPESLVVAIQRILQDTSLHQQMSRQAAETARQKFDANRMIEEYGEWYQKILP